jgi:uncharacterized protein (DUF1800 family)
MANSQQSWASFAPSAAEPWDLKKVAHLHRRAGFGATWAELQRDLKDGPAPAVERLLKPRPQTPDEQQLIDGLRQGVLDSRDIERLKAWWLYRLLYDPDPLREKMTLFWHGHFATSNRKVQSVPLMLHQNELFRRHALGSFSELLAGVASDGAMLVWLDGAGSRKEKPNENFSREFLELFTLGVSNYTEEDIRQAARAFTGWERELEDAFELDRVRVRFVADQFDRGDKTFLKQTGRWKPADIVRITLEQPAAARFLVRKLYRYFVSETDEPGTELIEPLAEELRRQRYAVAPVVATILGSQHFYSRAAYRKRVKSPAEFSVGLVRALAVPRADVSLLALAVACERQGQDLFAPPNVKGWDGGKSWINSTTLIERGNWINDVVWGNGSLGLRGYDPVAWAAANGIGRERTVPALAELLLQNDLAPEARELANDAARDGTPDGLRKALQRLCHCPEYQLA